MNRSVVILCGLLTFYNLSPIPNIAQSRSYAPLPNTMHLVQTALDKEKEHARSDRQWMVRVTEIEAGHSKVFQRVETSQGNIQRLLFIDGRTATGPEKDRSDAILHSLLTSQAARDKQMATHQSDLQDELRCLERIPRMYVFTEVKQSESLHRIHFVPNPAYKPANYKERVLHVLSGDVVIDAQRDRFIELSATVSESLTFGLGLIGYLNRGGSLYIRREEVAGGLIKTQESKVDLDGKIALIKDIGKHQSEILDDYSEVPGECDILCGLRLLNVH